MPITDILYGQPLSPTQRRNTTFIARRAVAYWADRNWLSFDADTILTAMNPDVGRLRDLLAEVTPMQPAFGAFDVAKFAAEWDRLGNTGVNTVKRAYDAVWAGF